MCDCLLFLTPLWPLALSSLLRKYIETERENHLEANKSRDTGYPSCSAPPSPWLIVFFSSFWQTFGRVPLCSFHFLSISFLQLFTFFLKPLIVGGMCCCWLTHINCIASDTSELLYLFPAQPSTTELLRDLCVDPLTRPNKRSHFFFASSFGQFTARACACGPRIWPVQRFLSLFTTTADKLWQVKCVFDMCF